MLGILDLCQDDIQVICKTENSNLKTFHLNKVCMKNHDTVLRINYLDVQSFLVSTPKLKKKLIIIESINKQNRHCFV